MNEKKTKHLEQFDCSDVENAAVFKSDVGKKNEKLKLNFTSVNEIEVDVKHWSPGVSL